MYPDGHIVSRGSGKRNIMVAQSYKQHGAAVRGRGRQVNGGNKPWMAL